MIAKELEGADLSLVETTPYPRCKIHGAMLTTHTGRKQVYRCMTSVGREPCKQLFGGAPRLNLCRAGAEITREEGDR